MSTCHEYVKKEVVVFFTRKVQDIINVREATTRVFQHAEKTLVFTKATLCRR